MNAVRLTLRWVADAVGGRIGSGDPNQVIGGVGIDSRTLQSGDFFIALRGDRFDGHAFLGDALGRGAAGAMVQGGFDWSALVPAGWNVAIVEVAETTKGLQDLARAVRKAAGTTVVAITGSAGKTTTKETIAAFLSRRFQVVKNKGNLNNHIGLPLSLLQLRDGADVAVMELGMNHAGEISTLVKIAQPGVRVWTNVGDAHVGFFASADAIADAKAEILEGGGSDDLLVCNADDQRVMSRAGAFGGRVVTFGLSSRADVRAEDVQDRGIDGMSARVVTARGNGDLRIPLLGRGNLSNVLAATAVALDFDVPLEDILETARELTPAARRGAVHRLSRRIVLIDDSYNSSPEALRRALDVVAHEAGARRKIAVLGEMLELGEHAAGLHEACGRAAAASGLAALFVVGGPAARRLGESAVQSGMSADAVHYLTSSEEAGEQILGAIQEGDLILVKGSRGIRTDVVADRIRREFA